MSEDANFEPREDETRVLERIRISSAPTAGGAFRERLKREFVSGDFGERRGILPLPQRRRTHRVRWMAGLAAAAAAMILTLALNQAPRWTALPGAGSGTVVVDGVALPIGDAAGLTRHLRPGSRLVLRGTKDLDLVSSGLLALQLSPGTEVVLPTPPGRWFGRAARGSVDRGHLRITTGRHFDGSRLAITTPDATVHVTGTTLAVIAEPTGTCVCVLEGTAHVRPHRGTMTPVPPGTRCEVARGDASSHSGEIRVAERPKLLDLRDRLKSVMN
jgi:ferric-dicitrate binding protein FerR (iron transport regulator)